MRHRKWTTLTGVTIFGNNLRRLREAQNLSREKLSDKTAEGGKRRIAHSTISRIELEDENPTVDVLTALAEALGVYVGRLFDQADDTGAGHGSQGDQGDVSARPAAPRPIDWPDLLHDLAFALEKASAAASRRAATETRGAGTGESGSTKTG